MKPRFRVVALGPVVGEDALRVLIERGVLDRVAARAVALVLAGRLDERDLKQLLDTPALQSRLPRLAPAAPITRTHPLPFPLNSQLGRFRVLGLLGRGASGHVYRSVHPNLGVPVALKVSTNPAPLRAEAEVLARITHPNVVRVWDLEQVGRLSVLVLEYLDGESLARTLSRGKVIPAVAFRAARDMLHALAATHASGVVHCDVKPSNVIATTNNGFKLVDFGAARVAQPAAVRGTVLEGTWTYAAPECFDGRGDHRSDIYSLGLTLYHALTGEPPVAARGFSECRAEHGSLKLDPLHWSVPGVSRRASELILRMTASDPSDRPAGARLLAHAKQALCRTESTMPSHPEIAR